MEKEINFQLFFFQIITISLNFESNINAVFSLSEKLL